VGGKLIGRKLSWLTSGTWWWVVVWTGEEEVGTQRCERIYGHPHSPCDVEIERLKRQLATRGRVCALNVNSRVV
jgi:hypothetical protein